MILLPFLLILGIAATTLTEPAPVNKTTKEIYQERRNSQEVMGYRK